MKFANVNGQRRTAEPKLSGECPVCRSAMTAKCGERNVWHWAHVSSRSCDHWWEPETQWHREWKNQFPEDWQEVVHLSDNGEKHTADVKTSSGTALEFQHSWLRPDERRAREAFYRDMVWVVHASPDHARRLLKCVVARVVVCNVEVCILRSEGCTLLRSWGGSGVPVYFDFRDDDPNLWRLSPSGSAEQAFLMPIGKVSFVAEYLLANDIERACNEFVELARNKFMRSRSPRPVSQFERYVASKDRAQRRF